MSARVRSIDAAGAGRCFAYTTLREQVRATQEAERSDRRVLWRTSMAGRAKFLDTPAKYSHELNAAHLEQFDPLQTGDLRAGFTCMLQRRSFLAPAETASARFPPANQ